VEDWKDRLVGDDDPKMETEEFVGPREATPALRAVKLRCARRGERRGKPSMSRACEGEEKGEEEEECLAAAEVDGNDDSGRCTVIASDGVVLLLSMGTEILTGRAFLPPVKTACTGAAMAVSSVNLAALTTFAVLAFSTFAFRLFPPFIFLSLASLFQA
jgi:hypothetical protein